MNLGPTDGDSLREHATKMRGYLVAAEALLTLSPWRYGMACLLGWLRQKTRREQGR
jgi:hypothetical protein